MTKYYFAPHKILAKLFCGSSKIFQNFHTPPIIAPPGYPELKMAGPLGRQCHVLSLHIWLIFSSKQLIQRKENKYFGFNIPYFRRILYGAIKFRSSESWKVIKDPGYYNFQISSDQSYRSNNICTIKKGEHKIEFKHTPMTKFPT